MRITVFVLLAVLFLPVLSHAHDKLADGSPVPAWIKKSCCGPEDYHVLRAEQVHAMRDGWHVDGYFEVIPYGKELPSPDGTYAAFWFDRDDGTQSTVFCFFVPPQTF